MLARHQNALSLIVLATVFQLFSPPCVIAADNDAQLEFFESKIRPILVKHCYSCHSANAKQIKGGLRLDTADTVLKGGDSGPSIVVGKPNESLLIDALRYDGVEMPPDGRLPNSILKDFQHWIATGAVDPRKGTATEATADRMIDINQGREFWAFRPIKDHAPPLTNTTKEPVSSIDAFIDARLQANGLRPVAQADIATLVRRIYFDLTGLPPSAVDLKNAVAHTTDDAFESLVDRLLASPQFGVHWGRHWLDVARYADSNGGDFNATFHNAWKYRDYVVNAMNDDKPFDRFVTEQIAGDLLPFENNQKRTEQLIATGFLMLGTKMLSERDKDKLTMDVVDEQVSTVGSAFLGMTLGCARCHDHKFDPIPTHDYYALAGIFRSTRTLQGESQKYVSTWTKTPLPVEPPQLAASKEWDTTNKRLTTELATAKKQLAAIEKHVEPDPLTVDDSAAKKTGQWKVSTFTRPFVSKGYIHDDQKDKGKKSVEFPWTPPKTATYEVRVSYTASSNRAKKVPVFIQHADGESQVFVDQTKRPEFDRLFTALGRYRFAREAQASVRVNNTGTVGYVLADAVRFVEMSADGKPVKSPTTSGTTSDGLSKAQAAVTASQAALKKHQSSKPPALPKAIATTDLKTADDCELCIRGEHLNRGPRVPRGFLQVVGLPHQPTIAEQQSGRRELADWIVSPNNPLTARVIVNRVWHHLIGRGIVSTVDNFGQLGDRPTHPELLDHLAIRFITPTDKQTQLGAQGYGQSIKRLVKEIVMTDVWQRSTTYDESMSQADSENKLLWKAHRRRIPAEGIRDSILAISEQLELSPGGSPVEGLGTLVKNNQPGVDEYAQKESLKRSLYLPIIRNELPPILTIFDFADPDLVVGRRPVTNVPAQALFMMNSPFVINAANRTAKRLSHTETNTCRSVIVDAYQTVLARPPTAADIEHALKFLKIENGDATIADEQQTIAVRLPRLIHVLFASTEFRMLN